MLAECRPLEALVRRGEIWEFRRFAIRGSGLSWLPSSKAKRVLAALLLYGWKHHGTVPLI
jgi:hypothetical protein